MGWKNRTLNGCAWFTKIYIYFFLNNVLSPFSCLHNYWKPKSYLKIKIHAHFRQHLLRYVEIWDGRYNWGISPHFPWYSHHFPCTWTSTASQNRSRPEKRRWVVGFLYPDWLFMDSLGIWAHDPRATGILTGKTFIKYGFSTISDRISLVFQNSRKLHNIIPRKSCRRR